MKIGIDARLWGPRGVGRYIQNLIIQLQKIDTKNEYILFVTEKEYKNVSVHISNSNFHIQRADIPWHSISEQLLLPSILNRENLDLMHFPYFSVPIFYKKPFIITLHDLIVNKISTGRASTLPYPIYIAKKIGYNLIVAEAVRKAKKIIVPTHSVKKELIDDLRISEKRINVTYEGSLFENLKISSTVKKENKYGKYFLYVGNAYPHKNLEKLIDAWSHFKNTDCKLILVGPRDYFYDRIQKKVKQLHLEEAVIFSGYVSDEQLFNFYKHAQALILPSLVEGFGLPAVEAMSLGCPVIISDIPVMHEVCAGAGIYINPNDSFDIKEKIEMVYNLDTKTRKEYLQKGLAQAKKFSWDTLAKKTLELYESCVSI